MKGDGDPDSLEVDQVWKICHSGRAAEAILGPFFQEINELKGDVEHIPGGYLSWNRDDGNAGYDSPSEESDRDSSNRDSDSSNRDSGGQTRDSDGYGSLGGDGSYEESYSDEDRSYVD